MLFEFKPKLLSSIAAAAMFVLVLSLGNWQLNRASEKLRLQQRIEELAKQPPVRLPASEVNAEDYRYRPVEVEGRFAGSYTIYIDNRIYHGVPGYHVITPLQIGNSARYVLIERGWIARGDERRAPLVPTPENTLIINGLAAIPSNKVFELSTQTEEGNVWQNLVLERYRKAVPLAIQPLVIEQRNDTGDGLVRDWEKPDVGINMHRGYAFQWFALAVAVAVLYVVVNVKRVPQKPH
ncbi:MAG TPA: SURF1 family protein [Burkholderiales bacterium]|nr:SURF1 family protein [Burkholderiales bacterium]